MNVFPRSRSRRVGLLAAAGLLASLGALAAGTDKNAPLEHQAEVAKGKPSAEAMAKGADLYKKNCAACHQPNGQGLPGAFPPLAGSDFLAEERPMKVLSSILQGISGKMVVNGGIQQRDAGNEPHRR
jgi:mono/diheme cytochrome c family protein